MTDQLQFRKTNDWTLTGSVRGRDLYEVRRQLNYDKHPASSYDYLPRCLADPDRVIGASTYTDSKLARLACQDDLDQQARLSAATTQGASRS